MLQYKLTRRHAGLTIWGDSPSLRRLYDFIHEVNEQSPWIEDKEGFVLDLAYDIRHAMQGDRRKAYRDRKTDDQCRIYGVEQLWPMLLAQVAFMRKAMGYMPTSSHQQAVMYELESMTEVALRDAIPATADVVLCSAAKVAANPFGQVANIIYGRCRYFVQLKGKQRLEMLPAILDSLDWMYQLRAEQTSEVEPGYIAPEVFGAEEEEFPDFVW